MSETTFIYGLRDPRDSQIRYVGKANDPAQRLRQHRSSAKGGKENPHSSAWLKSLLDGGHKPELVLLEEVSRHRWEEAEQAWIQYLRGLGCYLTNHTDGGFGPNGRKQSQEERAKRSVAMKKHYENPEERAKTAKLTARALRSPAVRARMSKAGSASYKTTGLGKLTSEQRIENAKKGAAAVHSEKLPNGNSKHAVDVGTITMSVPGRAKKIGKLGGHARWDGISKEERSRQMKVISSKRKAANN